MGFIQSLVGNNTGAGFQAGGVNSDNLTAAQNGVGNQQTQQNNLLQALQGQGGIQNQNQALQGLQGVAQQYQGIANGTGPNPAMAQLNQTTAANVAQTGALMAGQRGAGANVGLMARQAGQQGAATQQQAAGQAATMAAQQQLAGLQGLSGAQQNVANLATQQVGQQMGASQAAANTALGNQSNVYGLQSNINTTNAGIAAGNAKQQAGLIGGILGSVGAGSGGMSSPSNSSSKWQGGYIESKADGGTVGVQTPNAASNNPNGPQSAFGKYLSGLSSQFRQEPNSQKDDGGGYRSGQGLYNVGKAVYNGGKSIYNSLTSPSETSWAGSDAADTSAVDATSGASGSELASADTAGAAGAEAEGGDSVAALLAAGGGQIEKGYSESGPDNTTIGGTLQEVMGYLGARGGNVPDAHQRLINVILSPGEKIVPPGQVQKVAQGGKPQMQTVPGKATVPGDSLKNDKVATKVPAGTVIVKRTRANNNPEGFIKEVLAKRKGGK